MKIIFLDIDGVLNNFSLIRQNGFDYIDPVMVSRLALVVRQTGSEMVLSSTWRVDPRDKSLVVGALGMAGMSLIDSTPYLGTARCEEISAWLRDRPSVTRYAILDDDEDAGFGMEGFFFQTDPEVGLTDDISARLISHFNGGSNA